MKNPKINFNLSNKNLKNRKILKKNYFFVLLLFFQLFLTISTNAQYCTPAPTSVDGSGITRIQLNEIDNSTGDESGHYGDYSAQIANITQGATETLTITYSTSGYTYYTVVFIDWNNDFDFNDANEIYDFNGVPDATPTALSIAVPSGASPGNHRMRVGGTYNSSPQLTPCYTGSWATFEDYTVNVVSTGANTLSAGAGAETLTIPSTTDTQGEATLLNFDFTIADDALNAGIDADNTLINQIIFRQGAGNTISDWTEAIQGAILSDGTNSQTANIWINSDNLVVSSINFGSGNLGYIADNGNKTYTLKIWLKSSLGGTLADNIDGKRFEFSLATSDISVEATSSGFDGSQADVLSGAGNNQVTVTATELQFATNEPPASVIANQNFNVTVNATDENGNTDLDNTCSTTVSLNSGTGTVSSATGFTQSLVAGTYTWNDAQYNTEEIFTLQANGCALTTANSINIECIDAIQIGTGTLSSDYPFFNEYENNKTQMIYTAADVGGATTLTHIYFDISRIAPSGRRDFDNLKIKFMHTGLSAFPSQSFENTDAATTVFTGIIYSMPSSIGWLQFDINDFNYNGSDNLLVEVIWGDNGEFTAAGNSYQVNATNTGSYQTVTGYANDETPPNYDARSYNRPNIRLKQTSPGASTITAGTGSETAIISSLIDTQGEATLLNFDFTVNDDGATPATDITGTYISEISIQQGTGNDIPDWTNAIAGAILTDGTNTQTANITVNSGNIVISNIDYTPGNLGEIIDNASKTYTLSIWLKPDIETNLAKTIDGSNFVFSVTDNDLVLATGSSKFAIGQSQNSGTTNNEVDVIATEFRFDPNEPPASVTINTNFTATVFATDENGNIDKDNSCTVIISLLSGTGTISSATGLTQTLVSGTYTWTDMQYNTVEAFKLTASKQGACSVNTPAISEYIECAGVITIENPGSNNWIVDYPFDNSDDASRTQMLILQSEMGTAKMLVGLGFDFSRIAPAGYRDFDNFTIKIKHTSTNDFTSTAWEDMSSASTVLTSADYDMPTTTGWNYFSISNFNYNGTDNLIVEISWGDNNENNWSNYQVKGSNMSGSFANGCVVYGGRFAPPVYADYRSNTRPNIRFQTISPGTSTITPGAGTEVLSIPSLIDTQGEATLLNFDFTINDDGLTPATDSKNTLIKQIIIKQGTGNDIADWSDAIAGAILTDGTNIQTADITINSDEILIDNIDYSSGNLGYIADNGSKTYTLRIWLKSIMGGSLANNIDGNNFVFEVTDNDISMATGSSYITTGENENSGTTNNEVVVTATEFRFSYNQPRTSVIIDSDFEVRVSATDENGNLDTDNICFVTLSLNSGSGILSSATGLTQNLSAGTYLWTDARYDTEGIFKIQADGCGFPTLISWDINSVIGFIVGTGGSEVALPFQNYAECARTQLIYEAAELGNTSRMITNLSFDFTNIAPADYRDFNDLTIKMKHTNSSYFATVAYEDMSTASTVLNNIDYNMPSERGWHDFDITDFYYNGTDNLLIEIYWGDNNEATVDYYKVASTLMADAKYALNTDPDVIPSEANIAGNNRPNMRFLGYSNNWTGAVSTDWFNTVNWSAGIVPVCGTDAAIPDVTPNFFPIITGTAECRNLYIAQNANVQIATNGSLTVCGRIDNRSTASGLVIKADVTGSGSLIHSTASVSATVESFLEGNCYHYISSPITTASTSLFNTQYFYYWDASVEWGGIGASPPSTIDYTPWINYTSGNLDIAKGYAYYYSESTINYQGDLNVGNKNFTLNKCATGNPTDQGWNFLGNPYPSSIDWDVVVGTNFPDPNTELESAIYLFDDDGTYAQSNYRYYVPSGGTGGTYGVGTGNATKDIPPGQGFFVKALTDNINFSILNSDRVHGSQGFYKNKEEHENLLRLKVFNSENIEDELIIRLLEDATGNYDGAFDARKLFPTNESTPQIFSITDDNINASINSVSLNIPENYTVPLGFSCVSGNYRFEISEQTFTSNFKVYLFDTYESVEKELFKNEIYDFSFAGGLDNNRFKILFKTTAQNITDNSGKSINVYPNPSKNGIFNIYFDSDLKIKKINITDLTGKNLKIIKINKGIDYLQIKLNDYKKGIYFLQIEAENNSVVKKLIIN